MKKFAKFWLTLLAAFVVLVACSNGNGGEEGNQEGTTDTEEETAQEPQEDLTTDVVVVGGGGAGLAAGLEAKNSGLDVVILEKQPFVGGNTLRATGGMNAAETDIQAEQGVEDSVEQFYQDTYEGGHEMNDPDLLRTMVENSADALHWINDLGAGLTDLSLSGGATNPRIHKTEDGSAVGPKIIETLEAALADVGVEPMVNTEVVSIIEEDGRAVGVVAHDENNNEFKVNANAVILTTGGFGANLDMITDIDSDMEGIATTNASGAQGQGILMAQELGADTVDMEQIQVHPTTQPETGKLYTEGVRGDGAILVNKEGERFINELETRDVVSEAEMEQTDGENWLIVDQSIVDDNASLADYIEAGDAETGETIEELAEAIDVDADTLANTVETYNGFVEDGQDQEFGRENLSVTIDEGPYYALLVTPGIHHTMGGLKIDTETHVINTDGDIIPGLYAAGELVGGVHGGNRIGGNAVCDIIVFGRIAGQTAAENDGEQVDDEVETNEETDEETEEDAA